MKSVIGIKSCHGNISEEHLFLYFLIGIIWFESANLQYLSRA